MYLLNSPSCSHICWEDRSPRGAHRWSPSWAWACVYRWGEYRMIFGHMPPLIWRSVIDMINRLGEVLLSCVNRWVCYLQEKMDKTLYLLQNTDPADASPDGPELITLEGTRKTLPELLFNVDYIYMLGWGVQTKYDIIRNFRSCHYMALQNTLFLWTVSRFLRDRICDSREIYFCIPICFKSKRKYHQ